MSWDGVEVGGKFDPILMFDTAAKLFSRRFDMNITVTATKKEKATSENKEEGRETA